ncbi:hypothetical protein FIU86_04800 [Roseovarius sp. THAF9]|uniref:hypothetical protein n=1 Tax=Roseovarius sp. THAF9 TaxID=2587847 RepID=UPI00126846D1|nr:hypothetical protein [Roseovarius sp. THAF9]QFT92150.1 hypothetical protein FIU86_04800 [Roseovarius sp. THAF9]
MTDHTNFLNIVEGSEAVRDRWAALVERAVTEASEKHGVTLEETDILNLRSARTAALGAPLDEDIFQSELLSLPGLSDANRRKAISEGDEDARAAAVADVNRGKDTVHPDRYVDNAARRIARARSLGVATAPAEMADSSLSKEAKLEIIQDLPPLQRLQQARKWGLAQ